MIEKPTRICQRKGCKETKTHARGLCERHYLEFWKMYANGRVLDKSFAAYIRAYGKGNHSPL